MNQRYDVRGKTVLVTGAAQGIGLAVAARLHRDGAHVALLDVNASACEAVAASLGDGRSLALAADVRDRAAMAAAVAQVVACFGHLDVVVANAGVVPPPATLRMLAPHDFDRVVEINLLGVFNTVRPALEQIIAHRGHVVVMSSVAAFAPGVGGAPYMITKAAVEQFGRALRIELAAAGASAGVAYFGVVETSMARGTLDEHPLGAEINRMMPWFLRRRISAEQAADVIAEGIGRRAPRTLAPRAWQPYAMLRGLANVLVDHRLARDANIHRLVRQLEAGQAATRPESEPASSTTTPHRS